MYGRAERFLASAEQSNNWPAAVRFLSESRAALELLGKLLVAAELSRPRGPTEITIDVSASADGAALPAAREGVAALSADEEPEVDEDGAALF